MSLNFDVKSNLSLVRRFHTMEKLQKCVNFILTVPVFFATSCNWTPQIVERVNFAIFSHENCYLCVVFGPGAYLHFQRKVSRFHLKNVVQLANNGINKNYSISVANERYLKYFVEIILKLKFLIYRTYSDRYSML
jgi:hypothetical protein